MLRLCCLLQPPMLTATAQHTSLKICHCQTAACQSSCKASGHRCRPWVGAAGLSVACSQGRSNCCTARVCRLMCVQRELHTRPACLHAAAETAELADTTPPAGHTHTSFSKLSRPTAWSHRSSPDSGSMRISCALVLQAQQQAASTRVGGGTTPLADTTVLLCHDAAVAITVMCRALVSPA